MQAMKKEKETTSAGKQTATVKTLPHNAVNSLAAKIEAATTALIGDEEPAMSRVCCRRAQSDHVWLW